MSLSHFKEQGECRLNNIAEISHVVDALYQEDAKVLFDAFVKYRDALLKYDIDLEDHIIEYLVKGGYPGLEAVDFETARDILMERFGLTLHKDIMRTFAVRNIKGLENMVLRCAMQSSQLTNYHGFAKSIGIKYDTFMVYLGYLMDVFIVSESRFFSKSDSTFKKGKKLYLRDHATRNLLIGLMNRRLFEFKEEVGKTVETVVQDHACRLVYRLQRRMQCYYWRGKKEVDIVIGVGTVPVPIEVKYRDSPDDVAGLKEFMQEFGSKFGIVVTKDIFEVRGDILFVPLHLFLGVC